MIGFASATINFSSASSTDDTGAVTATQWYINNIEQSTGDTFSYTSAIPEDYTIKLKVTDQDSQTSSVSKKVNIVSNGQATQTCDSASVYMAKKLWTPFFTKCLACHTATGLAKGSNYVLLTNTDPFYISKNMIEITSQLQGTKTVLFDRAQGKSHAGGTIIAAGNAIYSDLTELQKRINTPPSPCP